MKRNVDRLLFSSEREEKRTAVREAERMSLRSSGGDLRGLVLRDEGLGCYHRDPGTSRAEIYRKISDERNPPTYYSLGADTTTCCSRRPRVRQRDGRKKPYCNLAIRSKFMWEAGTQALRRVKAAEESQDPGWPGGSYRFPEKYLEI